MVVPVLITSCQVSLKLKTGPVTAQATINNAAKRNAEGRPALNEVHRANRLNHAMDWPLWDCFGGGFARCIGEWTALRVVRAIHTRIDIARTRAERYGEPFSSGHRDRRQ